jgi:hypothetical protein
MNSLFDQAVAAEPDEVVPVCESATRYRSCLPDEYDEETE